MRVFPLVSAVFLLIAAACAGDVQPDHQAEWRGVLQHKQAATATDASAAHKQVYADSVRAFVQKHPNHSRAREVWERLQLEFADDLMSLGRYQDAIRYYRAVLADHPDNDEARRGLAIAADRLAVTREKLLGLEKGMSQRQVASVLGRPIPGWSARNRRAEATFEAWYYRTSSGGVAAVYFRDGKVFAAEESSHARIGRLGS
ncbi:MAG TPA: tetratricopeptide repeat protein [Thermoanaerobaculia bacterium]|nr:tetratricopeptide repeat protein [Thermoanaerobaculia bacterium]